MNDKVEIPRTDPQFEGQKKFRVIFHSPSDYFDTRMWPFHYTFLQPSYEKQPFLLFDNSFTIIEEQKHGGILTTLTTFPAVVIGFANIVHIWFPPSTTLLVPLKHFRSLHISEFFSQPMRILHISTADNHFWNFLHSESLHGLNNMDYRPLQMRRFVHFSMNNGHSISKSWQLILALHFTKSNTFNNGFPLKLFYIMVIMNKPNWRCFAHTCIFKVLGTHGMIRNYFVDYLWPMMKLKEPFERSIPHTIQKKYKWAINTHSDLPYGFVFLKRKKQFKKGRTLISYFRSRYGRLLQVTARTIDSMLLQLWPQTMGQLAVPQIWQTVHRFLSDTPLDVNLHAVNDDLVDFSIQFHKIGFLMQSILWFWNGNIVTQTLSFLSTCHKGAIHYNFPTLARFTKPQRRPRWIFRMIFLRLYRDRCHAIFSKPLMLFGNRSEELSNQPFTVQSCRHHCWTLLGPSLQRSAGSTFLSFSGHQICWQPVHFVSGRKEKRSRHSSSLTGWLLSTSRWIGGSHHQWTVGFCCWFQTSNGDIQTPRTMANSRFCISKEYSS